MVLPHLFSAAHRPTKRWFTISALLLGLGLGMSTLAASQDLPSRAGRIARVHGDVALYLPSDDAQQGPERVVDPLNWPVARGQRLVTEDGSSAEVSIGPVRVRLDARTDVRILDLDRDQIRLRLHRGTLALLMTESDDAREIEVLVDRARIRPKGRGLFRLDLDADHDPIISVETGSVIVAQQDGSLTVRPGQALQWQADGDWRRVEPRRDAFARWALQDDLPRAPRYVSSDTTGFEDLERHGRWEPTREWGMVWFPDSMDSSWAPYSQGRWTWISPWGWTWIDAAPWGFATSHYGRWIQEHGRWGWLPDDVSGPVVYAPAMVTWTQEVPTARHHHTRPAEFAPGYFWTPLRPHERYQSIILPQRTPPGERRHPHRPRQEEPRMIIAPTHIGPTMQPITPAQPAPATHPHPSRNDIRAEGIRLAPGLRPREVPHIPQSQPAAPIRPTPTIIQPARPVITPAAPAAVVAPPAPVPAKPTPVVKPAIPAATPAVAQPSAEAGKDERKHRHEEHR